METINKETETKELSLDFKFREGAAYAPRLDKVEFENRRDLFKRAYEGEEEVVDFLLKEWHMKVYTQEEINLLNRLTNGGTHLIGDSEEIREGKVVFLSEAKYLYLPTLQGGVQEAKLHWLLSLGEEYFLAGLTTPEEEHTMKWVVKLTDQEGFIPLFNAEGW